MLDLERQKMRFEPSTSISTITRRLKSLSDEQLTQLLFALNSIEAGVEVYNCQLLKLKEDNTILKQQLEQEKQRAEELRLSVLGLEKIIHNWQAKPLEKRSW